MSFEISGPRARDGVAERGARRVRMARRATAALLCFRGLDRLVDDATLIVSELVTNAIQHSGGVRVTFTMTVRDGFLRLAVLDCMPGQPIVQDAAGDAERGRGLLIVDCLAAANRGTWGTNEDGTEVWCSLRLPSREDS
ncbi:ATP-binding protein [Streptomyces cadmiisoli]|uniref:ATP-binding protein n=1 Tax=Streptomyces cadmiisoli TaxID=2184053 RepID=A0A2Z4IRS4_9ACTN|nr:ATP-binding protein [Streptomyces cadmiisoli]AWW35682.1 ATP-binding protein [Streptomyces cadmiisoli]